MKITVWVYAVMQYEAPLSSGLDGGGPMELTADVEKGALHV